MKKCYNLETKNPTKKKIYIQKIEKSLKQYLKHLRKLLYFADRCNALCFKSAQT